ncbi:MAG: homoserine kinase [SAR202 cluster bacterium]|nr:homoserine kinase [SAR202 cluster bacterium]
MSKITIKTSATSANMGPGFDCMAIALDIWNTTSIDTDTKETTYKVVGEGSEYPDDMYAKLVHRSFKLVYEEIGIESPSIKISCNNDIPAGKGLGSSAAAILAGLMAGNTISNANLNSDKILELAVQIEGHPDNLVAAMNGGCQIVVANDSTFTSAAIPISDELRAVIYVPEKKMPTKESRDLLKDQISRRDAVFNISRVGLLVRSLITGEFENLKIATDDKLHQPVRINQFFGLKNILQAAKNAGALGVFLSGSGPSILAITKGKELTIGYEMADAADKSSIAGEIKISKPTLMASYNQTNS